MFTLCCKQNNGGISMGGTIAGQLKESCGAKGSGKEESCGAEGCGKGNSGQYKTTTHAAMLKHWGTKKHQVLDFAQFVVIVMFAKDLKQCAFLISTEQPCVFNWRNSNTEPFRSQQTCKASKEILRTLSEDCSHEFKQGRSKWRKGRCHGRAHALLRRYQRRNAFA
jgi:hypothetical protein